MRVLGLDVGDKTIGVAVSDPLGLTAQGLQVIRRSALHQDLGKLAELCRAYQVEQIVVGCRDAPTAVLGRKQKRCSGLPKLCSRQSRCRSGSGTNGFRL